MKNYGNRILQMILKPNSIIVLLFIQNNSQFKNNAITCLPPSMLTSPSIVHVQGCSAPQIFSKQQMSPFELCSCCSCHVFSYNFAYVLVLKRNVCHFLFSQPKQLNLVPKSSRLTVHQPARTLHFRRHFFVKHKILQNLVISNWLQSIIRVLLANQNRGNILHE